MTLTGEPMLDAALLAGGAGAARALLAAWSQRAAVDHAKLAKNVILAFLVGAGVAYTGLPQAEILGALTALGVVDMAERAAKGIDGRVRRSPLGGPAKALTDLLDELRLAALEDRSPAKGAFPAFWRVISAGTELPRWGKLPETSRILLMEGLASVRPLPVPAAAAEEE